MEAISPYVAEQLWIPFSFRFFYYYYFYGFGTGGRSYSLTSLLPQFNLSHHFFIPQNHAICLVICLYISKTIQLGAEINSLSQWFLTWSQQKMGCGGFFFPLEIHLVHWVHCARKCQYTSSFMPPFFLSLMKSVKPVIFLCDLQDRLFQGMSTVLKTMLLSIRFGRSDR